jgi:capsular polysaccharide transport system permease protein
MIDATHEQQLKRTEVPLVDQDHAIVVRPVTERAELQRYGLVDFVLPTATPAKRRLPSKLLTVTVILPVLLGAIYNFVVASDRYVSTASYVVRETQRGGVLSLVGTGGMTRSDDDSFAIAEYITSRDAVDRLVETEALPALFGAPGIDRFSRFPTLLTGDTREDLYKHFQHYVDVDFNTSTGISTISVQAFTPQDAQRLTQALLASAEALVNNLNARARDDSVAFASDLVSSANERLAAAQSKMTQFRNSEQILNPDSEVEISNLLLTEMMRSLGDTEAEISQLTASAPNNPKIAQLNLRREALIKNIESQRAAMVGNNESLALKIEGYDSVRLERDLAEKSLINAVNALDLAKQESQKGHLYLERVVEPNAPDRYGYPERYWNMLLLVSICLSVFWIMRKTTEVLSEKGH